MRHVTHTVRLAIVAGAIALGLIALPIVSGYLILSNHKDELQARSEIEVGHLIRLIADGMRQPVWDLNPDAGAAIIGAVETDPRFVSVTVTSFAQGEFLYYARPQAAGADTTERTVPVTYDGRPIGEVRATIDRNQLLAAADAGWFRVVALVVLQMLVSLGAVALLIWFAMRIARDRALASTGREIEAFRRLLQETIDAAPVAISIKDRDLNYVFANRTALEKFGITRADIIGHTLHEAIAGRLDADYLDYIEQQERRILETGETLPLSPVTTGREGEWAESLLSKTPIVDGFGRISHLVTVTVDVTELKQTEALALAAKEEAELANFAKSEFLASMSHELRTPLNAIIGFSEIMVSETFGPLGNERYREYVNDIHQSGDHLHTIITDLLDVSRIEVGAIELNIGNVDLASLIASVCTMLRRKASRADVTLVDRCDPAMMPVRGDTVRLRQIFINLVDNAIKFTDAGGTIEIAAASHGDDSIAVTVTDTGIGIDADDIDRVVEPFVCVQAVATRNTSGTGLGLSLVKSLAELHGGELHITSEPGRGTRVTVVLPCAVAPVEVERRIA